MRPSSTPTLMQAGSRPSCTCGRRDSRVRRTRLDIQLSSAFGQPVHRHQHPRVSRSQGRAITPGSGARSGDRECRPVPAGPPRGTTTIARVANNSRRCSVSRRPGPGRRDADGHASHDPARRVLPRCRDHLPAESASGPLACVIDYHGGAFIMGSARWATGERADRLRRRRCRRLRRLSARSEHPFPAGR